MDSIVQQILKAILAWLEEPRSPAAISAALDKQERQGSERLDWRNSIVDLMKLTDQDSSLAARETLARQLGYPGPFDGSAAMNEWLHAQVMRELMNS